MYSFTERNKIHKWKRERRIGNTREEERKDGNTGEGGREGKEEMKGGRNDVTYTHVQGVCFIWWNTVGYIGCSIFGGISDKRKGIVLI